MDLGNSGRTIWNTASAISAIINIKLIIRCKTIGTCVFCNEEIAHITIIEANTVKCKFTINSVID